MLINNKAIIIIVLCMSIVFTMVGCSKVDAHTDEENKDQKISADESKEQSIKGIIKSTEQGKDGVTALVETNDGDFNITISMIQTELIGSWDAIKVGTEIEAYGELLKLDAPLIVAEKVIISDCKTPETDYETVGEIIAFEENGVHILTGDIAEIFNVDKDSVTSFYLGETVGVKRIDDNKFELEKYSINDFNTKYTSMGELITTTTGTVKEIYKNKLVLNTVEGDLEFELYEKFAFEEGTELTVDYLDRDEGNVLINYYHEDSKNDLVINSISRAENTGIMILDTEDQDGVPYEVYVLGTTALNFNHSDLKENDNITIYPEVIRESYPAQIDAKMIKK